MIIPVAVEKLADSEFAKIRSRQEALQTISPSFLDIFYHPFFEIFLKTRVFQQPPLLSTPIRKHVIILVAARLRFTSLIFGLSFFLKRFQLAAHYLPDGA